MSDAALHLSALLLAIAGMAALSLTIATHWRQLLGNRPQPRPLLAALRIIGAILLAASFALCAAADPILMAILVWPMLLMVGAGIVATALTVGDRLKRAS